MQLQPFRVNGWLLNDSSLVCARRDESGVFFLSPVSLRARCTEIDARAKCILICIQKSDVCTRRIITTNV